MKNMIDFWQRFRKWVGLAQTFQPTFVDEVPHKLEASKLYLVGGRDTLWSAALLCPCGCRSLIQLSLITDDNPCWRVTEYNDGAVTLHPSIWRIKGCRSHFFVRKN